MLGLSDPGVMMEVLQRDFSHFTDAEIEQIHTYLARQP